MPLLEVKNLTVILNNDLIIDNLNFSLNKGDVLAIIGPNGAGKTVLFKSLLGIISFQGEINWTEKVKIGYVPQRLDFDRTMPLTVNELFLLKEKGNFIFSSLGKLSKYKEKFKKVLEEVDGVHLLDKSLVDLSSGEFQRVLIAYALYDNPDVLFFDEPTAGIDVGAEMTIYSLLYKIAQSRTLTMFVISHDLNIIYKYADSVLCLNRQMLCYGAPQEVLTPERLQELYKGHTAFYKHKHKDKILEHHKELEHHHEH